MTTTLLQSLRERILDESESLAGLLRKCLALGMETNSNALRDWARHELHGYGDADSLPEYRKLPSPPIRIDSVSGNYTTTGQIITRLQVPTEAREFIAEKFLIQQPVEELEELAKRKSVSFSSGGLSYAQSLWNANLNQFQQIVNMSYTMNGSAITGVLSKIRTQLVEVIMDLTSDTPLTGMPRKDRVDQAVSHHIGTQYVTTIESVNGPFAIGTKSSAASHGLSVEDAVKFLTVARQAAEKEVNDQETQLSLTKAIDELRETLEGETAATGDVIQKAGKLRALAMTLGIPTLASAIGSATEAITELALSGTFG